MDDPLIGSQDIARARVMLEARRYGDAASILATHLGSHPEDDDALVMLSTARLGLRDRAGALEFASRALATAPESISALRATAYALVAQGRSYEARVYAHAALVRAPSDPFTHSTWVTVLVATGIADPATVDAARELVRLAPNDPGAYGLLADALALNHRKKEADAALRHARSLAPADSELIHQHALLDLDRNRTGAALVGFSETLAADPAHRVAVFNLRIAFVNLLGRVWFVVVVLGFALLPLAATRKAATDDALAFSLAVGCWTLLLAAWGVICTMAWRVVRQAGPVGRPLIRVIPRIDGMVPTVAILEVALLFVATLAVATAEPVWILPGIPLLAIALFFSIIARLRLSSSRSDLLQEGVIAP